MTVGKVLTYAGVASSAVAPEWIITNTHRPMLGAIRDQYNEPAGMDGSWLWSDKKGDVVVPFDCVAVSENTQRRPILHLIALWTQVDGKQPLVVSDEPGWARLARLNVTPVPSEKGGLAKFTLEFRCSGFLYELTTSSAAATAASATEPYVGSFVSDTELDTPLIIEVTAVDTLTDGFSITLNGVTLYYRATVTLGQTITINTISSIVLDGASDDTELTGAYEEDDVDIADVDGDYPYVVSGTNNWSLDRLGGVGRATIRFTWNDRRIG